MSDPLSIAASVTGLLTLAGQIYTIISGFVGSVADAPESAHSALGAVGEMRMVLTSVKQVMDQLSGMPAHRKEMIHVRHLVVTFREAVTSFSELEAAVRSAGTADGRVVNWDRVRWVLEEKNIIRIIDGLERHKTSLALMLSILQCESDIQAREDMNALQNRVEKLLEQNQALLRRLLEMPDPYLEQHRTSLRFFEDDDESYDEYDEDDQSTIRPRRPTSSFIDIDTIGIAVTRDLPEEIDDGIVELRDNITIYRGSFEVTLDQTRVYRRVQSRDSDVSFTSSAVRSNAWSMLSGLSLNDISIISVIALPITVDDINSIAPDLTFAKIISGDSNTLNTNENEATPLLSDRRFQRNASSLSTIKSSPWNKQTPNVHHQIVLLGDCNAGKSSLAIQFCLDYFVDSYNTTIDDSFKKSVVIDEKPCLINVLDTSGQEEYTALHDHWTRSGDGFLLVYSITSRSSFDSVSSWYRKVQRARNGHQIGPLPVLLVANDCDCDEDEREVTPAEGKALAAKIGCGFVQACPKNGDGVDKAFYDIVRAIRKQHEDFEIGKKGRALKDQRELAKHWRNMKRGTWIPKPIRSTQEI